MALGCGGGDDWPLRAERVSVVTAVGIQKWRVWRGLGGCLNAERPCSASRAGERTQVPGAAAPCSLHRAPWHVWQELAMEPQVSRAGVVSCRGSGADGRPPPVLTSPTPAYSEDEGQCVPQ